MNKFENTLIFSFKFNLGLIFLFTLLFLFFLDKLQFISFTTGGIISSINILAFYYLVKLLIKDERKNKKIFYIVFFIKFITIFGILYMLITILKIDPVFFTLGFSFEIISLFYACLFYAIKQEKLQT